jgi:hypothetical protein
MARRLSREAITKRCGEPRVADEDEEFRIWDITFKII